MADANEAMHPPIRGRDSASRFGPVGDGSLERAVHTVAHWMGTGVCDKRTVDNFYIYLQGFHAKLKELRVLDAERTKQRHEEDAAHLNALFVKVRVLRVCSRILGVSILLHATALRGQGIRYCIRCALVRGKWCGDWAGGRGGRGGCSVSGIPELKAGIDGLFPSRLPGSASSATPCKRHSRPPACKR